MLRRQLLRVAGVASGLGLTNSATAEQTAAQSGTENCSQADCIHEILGYSGFGPEEVEQLPDDLQPDHEVELLTEMPDSEESEGDDQPIPEFYFQPTGLAIESGDVVQFTLASPDHTITAYHPQLGRQRRVPEGVPPLSSPVLGGDASWLYRFDESGVYDLLCSPHEIFGMVMRIVVDEPNQEFGEVDPPRRRGPEFTADLVLNDDALAPERIAQQGQVGWDELADESKRLLVEFQEPPEDGEDTDDEGAEDGGDETVAEGDFEITEHELVEDDFATSVQGILVNNSGETVDYVEVSATFYDADGVRIDDGLANTTDLEDGEEWAFEIPTTEDPDDIADYDIEISDSPF